MERLLDVEQLAYSQTNDQIDLLEKYLLDYATLQKRLSTLPDKIQYDIMVPFGSVGFMAGNLVHTNEIKILIGDDWFLETSAKKAYDIIERRTTKLKDQIAGLKEQKKLIESRLNYTTKMTESYSENHNIVEIKEDYDEQFELKWKETHRENVKKYYKQIAQQKQTKSPENLNDEFWNKYEEVSTSEEEQTPSSSKSDGCKIKRRVSFNSILPKNVDTDLDESNKDFSSKTIYFKHSEQKLRIQNNTNCDNLCWVSPADIYTNFISKPKSILKKQPSQESYIYIDSQDTSISNINNHADSNHKFMPLPFSDIVVEKQAELNKESPVTNVKNVLPCSSLVVERNIDLENTDLNSLKTTTKKISKFKASRLKTIN